MTMRWRFAWAWTIGAVLISGCRPGGQPPGPPSPPPPTPPPIEHQPVCNPGDICGCWHQPPGQDWQKLDCLAPWTCNEDATPRVCVPPAPTPIPPGVFPVRFPKQSVVVYVRNSKYGNGVDSTLRIMGDVELCEQLHHVAVPSGDCHFESDVWTGPYDGSLMRATYEGLIYAGARDGLPVPAHPLGPVWQYKSGGEFGRCHDQREGVLVSCDHFGSAFVDGRDDPGTPAFEGQPAWLADQHDEFGPFAGFFMVPQITPGTPASVRACAPLSELTGPGDAAPKDTCGPWLLVDWR